MDESSIMEYDPLQPLEDSTGFLFTEDYTLFGLLVLPGSCPLRQCTVPDVESSDLLGDPPECRPGTDRSPVALGGKVGASPVGFRCRLRVR